LKERTVRRLLSIIAVALLIGSGALLGQEAGGAQVAASRTTGPVPLKLSLVFSRYQGEKKISSAPYTLLVTANEGTTRLHMGNEIPVPTTVIGKEGERSQSYNYRDVGTNIDCTANTAANGLFKLSLNLTESSVYYPDRTDPTAPSPSTTPTGAPAFRTFRSNFTLMLRDGQTVQSTSATDQVTGQVTKLDATLNVQK
jgi:hypothetical protein